MCKPLAAQDYVAEGLNQGCIQWSRRKGGTKVAQRRRKAARREEGWHFRFTTPQPHTYTHLHAHTHMHVCKHTYVTYTHVHVSHTYTHAFVCAGHFSLGLQGDVSRRGEGSPGASGPQSSRLGTFHLEFPRVLSLAQRIPQGPLFPWGTCSSCRALMAAKEHREDSDREHAEDQAQPSPLCHQAPPCSVKARGTGTVLCRGS